MRISDWSSDVCSSDLALRRPHDRRVASAAAEVAGQGVIDHALAGKIFVVAGHGEERHDEARRAEAALRAVAVDHRLLHGMQPAALRQMLDGDELAAIQSAEKLDAGVHGAVAQPTALARKRKRLNSSH